MAETKISKNQTSNDIFTTESLIAGDGIEITAASPSAYDSNTLAVYHFDTDTSNAITSSFGSIAASGSVTSTGAKWDKGFTWSSGEFFVNNQSSSFGTNNYTVDFWLCPTANNSASTWHIIRMVNWVSSASDNGFAFTVANNTVTVQPYIAASRVTTVQKTFAYQVPHHFAIERVSDNTFNLYIDGILFHTASSSSLNYNRFGVGQTNWNANITIDELRVSNVARYNGVNFTPNTLPYGNNDTVYTIQSNLVGETDGTTQTTKIGVGSVANGTGATAYGYNAQATASSAIQIGTGTNSTASTVQINNTQILNASGKIPTASIEGVVFTPSNLLGGSNVTIAQKAIPSIDNYTVGLYHYNGSLKDEISGQDGSFYYLNTANPRTPTYDDGGKFGKCASHTNNLFLQFVNSVSGTYTVDFWVKGTSTVDIGFRESSSGNYPTIELQQSKFGVGNKTSGTGSIISLTNYPSGVEFTANVWHHVAYVLDGANSMVYIFLDGHTIYSATKTAEVWDATQLRSNKDASYTTWIDEIRLSNVARWTSDFTPFNQPYGGDAQYEVSADVSGALTSIQGYNASSTQVLWNNMGTLMWVDTTYQGGN